VRIFGATISPDGAFVDYVRDGATPRMPELWRVPLLGGSPRRLMTQVHSTITWSPDGSQFAFVRFDGFAREGLFGARHSVLVGDHRDFSSRVIWTSGPDIDLLSFATLSALIRPPVWSPSGRRLAIAASDREGDLLLVVDAEGRDEKRYAIPGRNGLFGQAWLSDDDLVLNVLKSQGSATQLWHYSLADSRARRLTHDVDGFFGIDVSADRSTWVTSRSDIRVSLWIGDSEGTNGRELVGPMLYNYIVVERARVAWSGNQVFFAAASTRPESESGPGWRIAVFRVTPPDATALEVLGGVAEFVGIPSGEALIYLKACSRLPCPPGLWRSDADGGSAKMFLPGDVDAPVPTPDGKHLIYGKEENGVVTPWIVECPGVLRNRSRRGRVRRCESAATANVFCSTRRTGRRFATYQRAQSGSGCRRQEVARGDCCRMAEGSPTSTPLRARTFGFSRSVAGSRISSHGSPTGDRSATSRGPMMARASQSRC
jgi:hypothetical protein